MRRKRPTLREWDAVNAGYAEVKRLYRLAVAERTEFEKVIKIYNDRAKLSDDVLRQVYIELEAVKEERNQLVALNDRYIEMANQTIAGLAANIQQLQPLTLKDIWRAFWAWLT